jgi:alkylation response protein AidB-like acyl-CoA dehydrogenase
MTTLRETARHLFDLVDQNARAAGDQPVPQSTVDAFVDADLHAVMAPRAVGGLEASVVDAIDVFAEISRANGSAGWCLMANAATIALFGAWVADDFAKTLFADGVPLAAGQLAPNGIATPEGDGYRITGDYHFGSGVRHSAWIGAGVVTAPADGTDAQLRFALMPAAEAQFTGNWDVLGLESTASWDYSINDVWVPAGATFDFFAPVRRRGSAVYELGVMGLVSAGHAGFALGVVRRALDELIAIARSKQRMGSSASLRDSERFLIELANLEARARAAASWVRERFAAAEHTALETGSADPTEIALARQATVHATQDGADVVRRAYLLAGTDALRAGPLQTCFRDIHAGSQHFFAGDLAGIELGRALLAD